MRYLLFYLCILIFSVNSCFADTIILKNKRSINGIIAEENMESIVLDVGSGTITLPRTDIESIERSDEVTNVLMRQRWRRQYFESFPAPTGEDQEFLDDFKKLRDEKGQLSRAITRKDNIAKEVSILQSDISRLQDELNDVGQDVKATDPKKNTFEYNTLIIEFNSVNSKLKNAVNRLNELRGDYEAINIKLSGYVNRFTSFKELFEKRYQELVASDISSSQESFYESLEEKIDILQEDISYQEVSFTKRREGIVVSTVLNKSVTAAMIVDTGASLTVISEDVLGRLGINALDLKQSIELVVADGSRVSAKFIVLDSVKIGDTEAKNVEAAVMKGKPSEGVDGLLGMSFLSNFSFSIDVERQKLIFSSVE